MELLEIGNNLIIFWCKSCGRLNTDYSELEEEENWYEPEYLLDFDKEWYNR